MGNMFHLDNKAFGKMAKQSRWNPIAWRTGSERGVLLYFYSFETVLERGLWFCFRVLIPVILCLARWPGMTLRLFKTFVCQFCELLQTALCHCFCLCTEVYIVTRLTLICSIPSWHHGSRFPDLSDTLLKASYYYPVICASFPSHLSSPCVSTIWNYHCQEFVVMKSTHSC